MFVCGAFAPLLGCLSGIQKWFQTRGRPVLALVFVVALPPGLDYAGDDEDENEAQSGAGQSVCISQLAQDPMPMPVEVRRMRHQAPEVQEHSAMAALPQPPGFFLPHLHDLLSLHDVVLSRCLVVCVSTGVLGRNRAKGFMRREWMGSWSSGVMD